MGARIRIRNLAILQLNLPKVDKICLTGDPFLWTLGRPYKYTVPGGDPEAN